MGRKYPVKFMNRKKIVSRGKSGGRKPKSVTQCSTTTNASLACDDPSTLAFSQSQLHKENNTNTNWDESMELRQPTSLPEDDPYSSSDDLHLHFTDSNSDSDTDLEGVEASASERKLTRLHSPFIPDNNDFFVPILNSVLFQLISTLACPACKMSSLQLSTKYSGGLNNVIVIDCDSCGANIFNENSSSGGKVKDITLRTVVGMKECGITHAQISKFFSILGFNVPFHHKTFQDLSEKLNHAATNAAEECMNRAAVIVKGNLSSDNIPETSVSYDGTWHKRGFSSHTGVGVAIDIGTGFVLDTQTLSNFCLACEKGPRQDDERYISWRAAHQCQKNCSTTAGAMETEAASAIFHRSVASRGLMYTKMLCDGDAKAHERVKNVYGEHNQVVKEDCVNHISKRMFNALTKLKSENKATLNRKLTKCAIEKITNVYAANLKRSAPDVAQMRIDVQAGMLHMESTDDHPQHHLCPSGPLSWCFYNRASALEEEPRKHRPTFSSFVGKSLRPVVDRLTDETLLSRCSSMKTQNANECFNSTIWARCPKETFAKRSTVETAVALAVLNFNCGPRGILHVFREMKIPINSLLSLYLEKASGLRIKRSKCTQKKESKWARRQKKKNKLMKEDELEKREGVMYGAGEFNE